MYSGVSSKFHEATLGQRDSVETRRASRAGVYLLGHGTVLDVQTLAQQANGQDISDAERRQVPALLFLFHRRPTGLVLRAASDMAAMSAAALLQRAQLAGHSATKAQPRF